MEKYRPRTLDEVVGNADAVARLRMIAQEGNLPNVIFSGPPGYEDATQSTHKHIHTHTHTYICMYTYVCVCVCVW